MSQREKLLKKMRQNPRDWRVEDLKALADHYRIAYDQTGSHITFSFHQWSTSYRAGAQAD